MSPTENVSSQEACKILLAEGGIRIAPFPGPLAIAEIPAGKRRTTGFPRSICSPPLWKQPEPEREGCPRTAPSMVFPLAQLWKVVAIEAGAGNSNLALPLATYRHAPGPHLPVQRRRRS